jgi:lipopolysaccharide heptosyltransferase I
VSIHHSNRILAVRLSSLGDVVHTVPIVPALRSAFPDCQLDWLVDWRWSPLVKLVRGIDNVITLRPSISGYLHCMRQVRGAQYSCVIDFQGIHRSALLAWISGAERRIGRDRNSARERGAAKFYTDRVVPSGQHVAEMSMSLAVHAGVQGPTEMQFPIQVPAQEISLLRERLRQQGAEKYIVVSPGGGWKSKCWPAERFGALCAEMWKRHGIRSVINLAPGEDDLGQAVVANSLQAKPMVYCPALPELVDLLSQARVVVGGDTGPLHLAAALGTRVVALFGPTNGSRNGPLPRGLVIQNYSSSPPNYQRGDYPRGRSYSPEMLSITVDQVFAAVDLEISKTALAHHQK